MTRRRLILVCLGVAAVLFAYAWNLPIWRLERLLAGAEDVEISELQIEGQGTRLFLRGGDIMRDLTEAVRAMNAEHPQNGSLSNTARIRLHTVFAARVGLLVGKDGRTIAVAMPRWFDDPEYYAVTCPEPVPAPLLQLLDVLKP
jgi:hypothetical protein